MKTYYLSAILFLLLLFSFDKSMAQAKSLTLYRDTTLPIPRPMSYCPANTDTEKLLFEDVKYHDFQDFQRLMQKGMDINLRESLNCDNLLTLSVIHNNTEVFNYLLERGADYNSYGKWGNAACEAALWGRTEFMKILLEKGVSPDSRTTYGSTLLHFAVSEAKYETIDLLIKYKARMDIRDADGDTVLEKARKRKLDRMVQMLLDAGAK